MSLKTLIVDDEPVARKVLREELEFMRDVEIVEIVGEAEDGPTALAKIARDSPDLVFLDLQMPVMGGLEVIRGLKGGARVPVIVIVTAYDEFALQAFDAGAIDYLLKPHGDGFSASLDNAGHHALRIRLAVGVIHNHRRALGG
jgi:CheY-like chemotaxis protein